MQSLSSCATEGTAALAQRPAPSARRGRVRPIAEQDLRAIVALYLNVFGPPTGGGAATAEAYLRTMLFEHPWVSPEYPSLVYEDSAGELVGLLGVIARPMTFRGKPIRMAIGHHFMVAPEARTQLASVQIAKTFLSGPQDLSVAEACSPWRRMWEALGGSTSLVHGLGWARILRPGSFGLEFVRRRGLPRVCAAALRPVCCAIDALVNRMVRPLAPAPSTRLHAEPLDPDAVLASLDRPGMLNGLLAPVFDARSLGWVFDRLRQKTHRGTLTGALLREQDGSAAGWFLYYLRPGGMSHVVQWHARPEHADDVFDHLAMDALTRGAGAVGGQLVRSMVGSLGARPALIYQPGDSWVLVHSKRDDLLRAVHSGDAAVSRLDTEWWITY